MTPEERELSRVTEAMRVIPGEQTVADRVWRKLHSPRSNPGRRRLALLGASAAAIVAVALAGIFIRADHPGVRPTADRTVVRMVGVEPKAQPHEVVRDRVTPAAKGARIEVDGVARIAVIDAGAFSVSRDESSFRMSLQSGRQLFTVERLRPGYRFAVVTPHAEVFVKGTVFEIGVTAARTEVLVREGAVSCIAGGVESTVTAGQVYAQTGEETVAPGQDAPKVRDLPAPASASAEKTVAMKADRPGVGNGRKTQVGKAQSGEALEGEARALFTERRYAEAVERLGAAYDAATSADSREEILFKKGQVELLNLKAYRAAASTFARYLDEHPNGTYVEEAIFHVAEAYGKLDDVDKAVAWFDMFTERSHDAGRKAAAQYNAAAIVLRLTGDCARALPRFDASLGGAPSDIERKALPGAVACRVKLGIREGLADQVDRLDQVSPADPVAERARAFLGGR